MEEVLCGGEFKKEVVGIIVRMRRR